MSIKDLWNDAKTEVDKRAAEVEAAGAVIANDLENFPSDFEKANSADLANISINAYAAAVIAPVAKKTVADEALAKVKEVADATGAALSDMLSLMAQIDAVLDSHSKAKAALQDSIDKLKTAGIAAAMPAGTDAQGG